MDVLPLVLLLLALFVAARLVQMALDPGARQNAGAAGGAGLAHPRAAQQPPAAAQ